MKTLFILTPALLLLALGAVPAPESATAPRKSKPAAKAVAKAKTRKLIKEVMGTEQLTGWEGSLGEMFTLGTNPAFNFALKKAQYSAGRANIGISPYVAKADEKLLVLHFTIQNSQPRPMHFGSYYLSVKAVDSGGVTREYVRDIARENTGESISMTLNRGQKVDAYTVIPVAGWGEVPKLIVANAYTPKAPVVRYDLRGKVAKLAAPFAEPKDGATALKLVPVKAGQFYPVTDRFDARLDSVTYSSDKLQNRAPSAGKRFVIATFTLQNKSLKDHQFSQSVFRADLKDADGEKTSYNNSILKGSRDEEAGSELAPGEEARVRFYWELPEKVEPKTILLQYGYDKEARTFAYDVASVAK
ncbi:MAG TPA: DUF4352 domain-containing protein [Abditibacterium sp.]|jgi:hypothetical protein